ncbi:glycoside hydrolase family 125 protein [Acidicapsa dinghuensis]|uniref:Glycoside hydrolase family 125 protein n=1 Tax=Acidicapsa dinghuensis TaxID=2218256 RepID=A0ABW1EJF5_9BACT|nr:glycoside hydrolase family 125 protein [Acidicapsa dinghuensis]
MKSNHRRLRNVEFLFLSLCCTLMLLLNAAAETPRKISLSLQPDDVLPTGNEWIALPDIRASDGALTSFNAISMRDRGLLQVNGDNGSPALTPYFTANGKPLPFHNPAWELTEYWIPSAHLVVDGMEMTLLYCAPSGSRAAFLRLSITNRQSAPVPVTLGVRASFGRLSRVTYVPVELRGERTVGAAPWVDSGEVFSYITTDTQFAWSLIHPGSKADVTAPPLTAVPAVNASKTVTLAPGETTESLFILGIGIEEFSAAHNAKALREMLDRNGYAGIVQQTAAWCHARTRTTGHADLDTLMNRNFLFTELYAWGRTIDTEQWVGVTSRSPRYYVSAAYWDRDAMLWSFPALLDIDPPMAAQALEYALTTQLRNTGTHSRFIDGVVLEDGFQLDEADAPVIALASYIQKTNDVPFLERHRDAVATLRDRIFSRFDKDTGLYSSLQDSQDEFQIVPFLTYDNALTWKALLNLSDLFTRLNDSQNAQQMTSRADALHAAIMKYCVSSAAPAADGPMFVSATDGKKPLFTEIPPGALMKLPALGFIPESDPIFERTYRWLHSKNYAYSYAGQPYGFPGSYRVPFTTSWSVADHLLLNAGREQALKVLRASEWDGGIITEGVDPATARMDQAGRAFATAAGYVAHAICKAECTDKHQ